LPVVAPLLALRLATGDRLVVQAVPPALLEFSRSAMRARFSAVVYRPVYAQAPVPIAPLLSPPLQPTSASGIILHPRKKPAELFFCKIRRFRRIQIPDR